MIDARSLHQMAYHSYLCTTCGQRVDGNATVTAYGSATVIRWSKTAAVTLSENAVMVDRSGETVVCV